MAIRGNINLEIAQQIIDQRWAAGVHSDMGETVIINSNEDPLVQVILTRHVSNVRVNDKVAVGELFMEVVPEWLVPAVIEWGENG